MGWFLSLLLAAILGFMGWLIYLDATSEKIHLIKADWECTKFETSVSLMPIYNGQSMTMVPTTHVDCVEYRKRGENNATR